MSPFESAGGGSDKEGSWIYLQRLCEKLGNSEFFLKTILYPTMRSEGGLPSHDRVDELFMHYAWRCPWPYVPRYEILDAWREAYLRLLVTEFQGQFLDPEDLHRRFLLKEQRTSAVVLRDSSRSHSSDFVPSRIGNDPDPYKNIFVLKYSGDPDDDEILQWRLLLPWRSIVTARTLILDRQRRSRLNRRFVLA